MLLVFIFAVQKVLIQYNHITFVFIPMTSGLLQKLLYIPVSRIHHGFFQFFHSFRSYISSHLETVFFPIGERQAHCIRLPVDIHFSQKHLPDRQFVSQCMSKMSWLQICGLTCSVQFVFHLSTCILLCHYSAVIALQNIIKSSREVSPALFSFLSVSLPSWQFLWSYTIFKIVILVT